MSYAYYPASVRHPGRNQRDSMTQPYADPRDDDGGLYGANAAEDDGDDRGYHDRAAIYSHPSKLAPRSCGQRRTGKLSSWEQVKRFGKDVSSRTGRARRRDRKYWSWRHRGRYVDPHGYNCADPDFEQWPGNDRRTDGSTYERDSRARPTVQWGASGDDADSYESDSLPSHRRTRRPHRMSHGKTKQETHSNEQGRQEQGSVSSDDDGNEHSTTHQHRSHPTISGTSTLVGGPRRLRRAPRLVDGFIDDTLTAYRESPHPPPPPDPRVPSCRIHEDPAARPRRQLTTAQQPSDSACSGRPSSSVDRSSTAAPEVEVPSASAGLESIGAFDARLAAWLSRPENRTWLASRKAQGMEIPLLPGQIGDLVLAAA